MIEYFPAKEFEGMQVKIMETVTPICSISRERFSAKIIIEYTIKNEQIELVSLRKYLKTFEEETIESLCKKIKCKLKEKLPGVNVRVIGESPIHPTCEVML